MFNSLEIQSNLRNTFLGILKMREDPNSFSVRVRGLGTS